MTPLSLFYDGVALHDFGTISVLTQQTAFSPDALPQKETRTVTVRIDARTPQLGFNYDALYAKMRLARTALGKQNKVMKWQSPGPTTAGDTQLQRPVTIVSHDLPEDPNGWGVLWQQINITFRYELDRASVSGALTATMEGSGVSHGPISLGQVHSWKDDYKASFYSEWKDVRSRASGNLAASGEIFVGLGETGVTTDNRIATLVATIESLKTQFEDGRYVTLVYGDFFNRRVKVESFTPEIADAPTGKISWTAAFSYTRFPDEDSYAGAEFNSALSQDLEAGMETLGISGKVTAVSESLAMSKLDTLLRLTLTHYVYVATAPYPQMTRNEVTKQWVNAEDTKEAGIEANEFFELSFSYAFQKKMANVLSFKLNVSDADDLKSGMITRTYAGEVVASGADEAAAYDAALAKARLLGDKKHSFRVSCQEARSDRQMANQGSLEFLRLEFSYVYQLKGTRLYIAMTSSVADETFGESQERVSGTIIAGTEADARAAYTLILNSFNTPTVRLIRNQTVDVQNETVNLGLVPADADGNAQLYGAQHGWSTGTGNQAMFAKLDFSFSAFAPKPTGWAVKYGLQIQNDYLKNVTQTTVDGVLAADLAALAAIELGTAGNTLDTFLDSIATAYGTRSSKSVSVDKEQVGTSGPKATLLVHFNASYSKKMTGGALIACSMKEDIVYSGVRNVFQSNPDGADEQQDCGITQAQRTVSGSVTAATEDAAMTWIKLQRARLLATLREPASSAIYEEPIQISTSWEYPPLNVPTDTGRPSTFQVVVVDFTFRQIIPNLPKPSGF